ncbi:MAG: DUF11 domain-containing protein [Anaerolineales bacterium]|nr:DUF11 domain-containing protein [Anaerolineales bacterium]
MKSEPTNRNYIYRGISLAIFIILSFIGLGMLAQHSVEATRSDRLLVITPGLGGLESTKSVSSDRLFAGDTLTYTIIMTNSGVSPLATLMMTDTLPSEVTYGGYLEASQGNWDEAGGVITWSGSLSPLETATITFTSQVTNGLSATTSFINTAEIFDGTFLQQASASATAIVTSEVYLPLILKNYPPITTLNPIPAPESHTYTVTWAAVSQPVTGYVLQESTSKTFTSVSNEWETTETEQVIHKTIMQGRYYYRVRADNDGLWGQGQWSNTRWFYFDDFTNSTSGWIEDDNNKRLYEYLNGEYRLLAKKVGELNSTIHPGDGYQNYHVEADVRWVSGTTGGWYGLIFGVNSSYDQYYAIAIIVDTQEFVLMRRKTDGFFAYLTETPYNYSTAIKTGQQTNHLAVTRNGDKITLNINGVNQGTYNDNKIMGTTWSGIMAGSVESSSVDARFDNFYLSDYVTSTRSNETISHEIEDLEIDTLMISDPVPYDLLGNNVD